jgi:hypothetical protein
MYICLHHQQLQKHESITYVSRTSAPLHLAKQANFGKVIPLARTTSKDSQQSSMDSSYHLCHVTHRIFNQNNKTSTLPAKLSVDPLKAHSKPWKAIQFHKMTGALVLSTVQPVENTIPLSHQPARM